jgi:hypothetical protein
MLAIFTVEGVAHEIRGGHFLRMKNMVLFAPNRLRVGGALDVRGHFDGWQSGISKV